MLSLVAATQSRLLHRMSWPERLVLLVRAILMIKPGWATDLAGIAILVGILLSQK